MKILTEKSICRKLWRIKFAIVSEIFVSRRRFATQIQYGSEVLKYSKNDE